MKKDKRLRKLERRHRKALQRYGAACFDACRDTRRRYAYAPNVWLSHELNEAMKAAFLEVCDAAIELNMYEATHREE